MVNIKNILSKIDPLDRSRLFYAFDSDVTEYVTLEDGIHFLGVNIVGVPHLRIIVEQGKWAYGSIQKVSSYV